MELKRSLSLFDSVSLMFSSMVGSGVFFTTGFILNHVENPWLVIFCWVLGGIFAVIGALTYAMPAVIFPQAGGDYIYLKNAYHPMVAFMSGWAALTITFSASISVVGMAFSKHLFYIFPRLEVEPFLYTQFAGLSFTFGPVQVIGMILVLIFTFFNYFGIKKAIFVQNTLTFIKITGFIVLVIAGYFWGNRNMEHFANFSFYPNVFQNWNAILLGVVPVTFSYYGWNMITYVAGEVKQPNKVIPLAILVSCVLVILLYVLVNILFMSSAPLSELKSQEGAGVISAIYLFGPGVKVLISGFICWILLGSMSAMIIGGSRIYYAMSNDGVFFKTLANLHPKYHTPYKALIFQAFYSSIFMFVKELESLLYLITVSILFLSSMTAFTPYVLAKKNYVSEYKIPGYPVTPLLFILFNFLVMGILTYNKPSEALWGLCIVLASIPVYFLFKNTFK